MRDTLTDRLERWGDRTAVVRHPSSHTYAELAGEIRRIETLLDEAGVKPHDAVVLKGDFSFSQIAALFALYRRKAVVVPVVTFTETTLEAVRDACRPRYVVDAAEDVTVAPFDSPPGEASELYGALIASGSAGLVLLSSGSTGAPKAVLHDFDALVAEKIGTGERVGRKPPHILLFLLADHIGGINSLLGVVRGAATAVVPAKRTPEEICRLVERYGIRLLPTSPTFLNLILIGDFHEKFDLSSLRLITYGTEPMPEELLRRVHAAFPRARLLQTFGTSETGISTTQSESSSSTYFRISDEGVEYRVVDGELQLRTRTQFMGYLNYSDEAVTADGWFRTGDLVEENADGYIKVKGRAKEIINVGGEKVLPLELESILMGSPRIAYCAVYGKPNSITGQAVHVDVKPDGAMSRAEVRRHVREFLDGKVEPFKMPAKVTVIDEIPVSARFKKKRSRP
ncbi:MULTISPECIES: class I adenylate-forming enzyme family protein [Streptomyces]|uniref:class I adenylate-forming enzyme family protein n=1 Tax=Streptomyces TaxID=1883 RepID=UPI0016769153|nr:MULTISPECIES: fatty acid--CoA ligase family protein [Streptomyces]MBK3523661.1 AMP-binding protein [Streptomyces sp. MBT70]GGR78661.1 AMP-dependent synthetase [Streptomyces eurythermus]